MKVIIFMLAFIASVAGAEDSLEVSPLGLQWGDTIQNAKMLYPEGAPFPILIDKTSYVSYEFSGNRTIYWSGIPVDVVQLIFTTDNKLYRIYFRFNFLYQLNVKQQAVASFGSTYQRKDENGLLGISWVSSQGVFKYLSINSAYPFEWAYIYAGKSVDSENKK